MLRRTALRSDHSGQAMVEVVLLFPFLLVLILLVVEFGFALHTYLSVNSSAREAARYGAVAAVVQPPGGAPCENTQTIKGRAVAASGGLISCGEVTVTYWDLVIDTPTSIIGRGDEVVVKVAHNYTMITPLSAFASAFGFGAIPSTFTIRACSDARLERSYPNDPNGPPTSVAGDCGS